MRSITSLSLAAIACVASLSMRSAAAQTAASEPEPIWEIGTRMGVSTFVDNDDYPTTLNLPGAGFLGLPTLHAMYVSAPKPTGPQSSFYIELESLLMKTFSGAGGTLFVLGLQPGYLIAGQGQSPYLGMEVVLMSFEDETQFALGPAVGYRIPVHTHFAVRLQAGYRRWLDPEFDELNFVVIIGAVFRA